MYRAIVVFPVLSFLFQNVFAQSNSTTKPSHQDTLKGSLTPERAWWNVIHYDLTVQPDLLNRTIQGKNIIAYEILNFTAKNLMQIDLQQPLQIDSVMQNAGKLNFYKDGNAWFIKVAQRKKNSLQTVTVFYSGKPKESVDPPWDGGVVWAKDSLRRTWVSVACQLVGASVWYPCKVHQSDEPDKGASITIITPDTLTAVANGRLKSLKKNRDGTISYTWSVISPINNYGITFYIGKYINISEKYTGEKGALDVSYWVLDYNLSKVHSYLRGEVHKTIKTFEDWFGPYPFYEDGFKMVEAPYVGMEHQSAIAYGNGFQWGRIKLKNLTLWDYKTDRLIVHETAHEWFGNNITTKDFTERWVHEGFAGFAEELFIEEQYGKGAAKEFFLSRTQKRISNKEPLIKRHGIYEDAGSDMYLKGWTVIHMIREIVHDEGKFRQMLRGLNSKFYHQTVTSKQIEEFISKAVGRTFSSFFDQYLRSSRKPVLEYKLKGSVLKYRFTNCVKGFSIPVKTNLNNYKWLIPTTEWKQINVSENRMLVADDDFYLDVRDFSNSEVQAQGI